jgi:GNAT superfamily N-acetyltransferase
VTVRPLAEADYTPWRELWNGYLDFYRQPLPEDVTASTFQRLVHGADGLHGLVAEDGEGRVVGFAHLVFHPSTWSTRSYCYLEDLFVAPAGRGTSIGRDLVDAVYAEADRRGADRTYWETQEFNAPARSLYDQVAHRTSFIVYER